MIAVHRYEVPADDLVHIVKLTGDPTGVGLRHRDMVEFWAVHNDDVGEQERFFTVVGIGHLLPGNTNKVWGYAYDDGGHTVWHLIEVMPS